MSLKAAADKVVAVDGLVVGRLVDGLRESDNHHALGPRC